MIRLDQVCFAYPQNSGPAVQNLSFTLAEGEFKALVGPNGSGKSTLSRLMNGTLLPQQGRVVVDGLDTRCAEQRRQIRSWVGLVGPVPDHQFVSNLVADDVAFGPQNLGLTHQEIHKRVDTALRMVTMEDYGDYPPYLLSGGQKQRVCLAGILALEPRYLILDEPTAMLDPGGRKELRQSLNRLRQESGMGILLITHVLDDTVDADQVLIMGQGQIQMEVPYHELAFNPGLSEHLGLEPPEFPYLINLLRHYQLLPPSWTGGSLDEVVEAVCRWNCKR